MATITKRGDTYRIRCSLGYDSQGKQVIRSTTLEARPRHDGQAGGEGAEPLCRAL